MTEKLYDLIYADPPWRYDFSRSKSRKVENQYPTMDLVDICQIKPPAKKDCVLYLWATAPKLEWALSTMNWWGFSYKSHCVWDKARIGMGYWWRSTHELLLVGTRGHFSPPNVRARVPSIFRFKRDQRHSKKPDTMRDVLSAFFPLASKVEMFARGPVPAGWDVWENGYHKIVEES